MLNPGSLLQGRYRIVANLGGGGMGTVYLAENMRLSDRQCAIKELSPDQVPLQERSWVLQTLRQEVDLLSKLNHPGLTNITDYFTEGPNQYLVMEYIEGETLEAKLAHSKDQRLSQAEALEITRQLCDVLRYLHDRPEPIVFRDLKPGNIMLTAQGQVKLIDFGIARLFKPGQSHDTVNLGTPGYAAPEQYGGKGQTSPKSDIYSLGVVLHQMLTGYDPTGTPFNLPVTRTLNAGVPAYLEAAIRRAIHIDPKQRFQTVTQMQQALFKQKVAGGRRVGVVLASVGLIGIVGVGGFMLWTNGNSIPVFSAATPTVEVGTTASPDPTVTSTLTPTTSPTSTPTPTRKPTATPLSTSTATDTLTPTVTARPRTITSRPIITVTPPASLAPTTPPCPAGKVWNPLMNRCQGVGGGGGGSGGNTPPPIP